MNNQIKRFKKNLSEGGKPPTSRSGYTGLCLTLLFIITTVILLVIIDPDQVKFLDDNKKPLTVLTKQTWVVLDVYCAWIVVPPIWFFLEYYFWIKNYRDDKFRDAKNYQDLAGKIWAAVVIVITVFCSVRFGAKPI